MVLKNYEDIRTYPPVLALVKVFAWIVCSAGDPPLNRTIPLLQKGQPMRGSGGCSYRETRGTLEFDMGMLELDVAMRTIYQRGTR